MSISKSAPPSPKGTPAADPTASPKGHGGFDDEEEWRHPPVAPVDAGIADSFGKAVSDVVTGPSEGPSQTGLKPKPARKP